MATKKITDLTLRSDFDATCNIPVDDTAQTWRTTGAQLATFIRGLPYWFGYHDSTGSVVWNRTANTFGDFTVVSGTANLVTSASSGLTVTTAASDLPGVTFTPINAALYRIKAKVIYQGTGGSGNGSSALRLWDGSATLSNSETYYVAATGRLEEMNLEALWVAPSASPVTIKVQGFVSADSAPSLNIGYINHYIEWIIEQRR